MRIRKANSSGFTLIELLIVIIIIGILAAIAFVAYSGAQEKARRASAESAISQSASKLAEYNANKGHYPGSINEFTTWLGTAEGGNNDELATTLGTTGYSYTSAQVDGSTDCFSDTDSSDCASFTITADASDLQFSGADVTANN